VPETLSGTEMLTVLDVAIEPRSGGGDSVWTYAADERTHPGDAVFVPLGRRPTLGYVLRRREIAPEDLGFPLAQLKPVTDRVAGLSLPPSILDLVQFLADEYLTSEPLAISVATPPGVQDRLVTAWRLIEDPAGLDVHLTALQQEVVTLLRESEGVLIEKKGKKLPPATVRALKLLRQKGVVEQALQLQPHAERRKSADLLRLTADEELIERFLKNEGKKRPAQALTVMRLRAAERAALQPGEIKALSGITDTTLRALVDAGLLETVNPDTAPPSLPPIPNSAQTLAIDAVVDSIQSGEYRPFLLYGVTGSGKTEVYLRAAAEALKQGRQVLYLVPEIALAAQAIAQLRERFGKNVAILHSELPPRERLENWMQIRAGEAPIVLGARSALFAPLTNIGLIILDEEHETSYKQESAPRYHAKRLAQRLAQRHRAALVLGSATPSVESYYEAEEREELTLLTLPERAAAADLPAVHIEDLGEGFRRGEPTIFGPKLFVRLEQTLARGEQAILFLNRRAYAPSLVCRDCGQGFPCPRCSVSLSYSQRDRRLRCHHCGFRQSPPDVCPSCRGHRLNPIGIGTEKVEEHVASLFPQARVARLDRDIARKKGALDDILARFRAGEIDVLVGTQMVAKGLDFPNVTLVGVIAADMSLNIPDFRASERTFQLLSQVAGRAGRGSSPGHVVIQTFNPGHVAIVCARDHDYISFYEEMREERRQAGYPPFQRLINIVGSGQDRAKVQRLLDDSAAALADLPHAQILGPTDCAIERIESRWRRHLLIKLSPEAELAEIGARLAGLGSRDTPLAIDVDPFSLT
jgi:primosomal protein N' (replication factor Y) (superfamily II helicase)